MPDATPNNVIQLRRRHDFASSARNTITAVRRVLEQTEGQFAATLAEHLGWTPTSAAVRGWETTGAVPPGDVLLAAQHLARAAGAAELPQGLGGDPDVVYAWAARRDLARPEWQDMIRDCQEYLWLYGLSEQGYANDADVPRLLRDAAGRGCDIRILLLNPDYPGIADIDAAEGSPPGTLAARIRGALHRFHRMAARCGGRMHIRTYDVPPTASIVRGDNRMLTTPALRYLTGGDSPTFLLESTPAGQMFRTYEQHFHQLWDDAKEQAAA
ncbi:DUF5919 domain-containing protein [Dactylosporangium sp. CA-139066]|uniref:DUF5919 domain-containing protein n=1 Tax=Dactylosporangium sp. CA-139066 TaxID=3239930 RepID=UPI003D8FD5C5